MNILIIDNSIGITGAIKAILETIENLKEHHFCFVIPKGSNAKQLIENKGYEVIELNFIEISRKPSRNLLYPFRLIRNAYKISKIVKKQKIDIIQVNDIYNLCGVIAKLFVCVKLITHIRRMPESFPIVLYRFWIKIQYHFSDIVLPVSHANAKIFKKKEKLQVLYDPAMMDQQKIDYQSNKGEVKILYLANYTRGKGQNYAIEALKILKEEKLNEISFKLKFVGGDFNLKVNQEFKTELKNLVDQYQLQEYIEFANETNNIFKEISECDIMLNFSDSESLSRVTMEALYYGIPIIATNVGGTNEMITHNFNGILVERKNVRQMAKELSDLIILREKRLVLSKNNDGFIEGKFSLEKISGELNSIYHSLR